jgi:predicted amino acid-binding ACT domain protein
MDDTDLSFIETTSERLAAPLPVAALPTESAVSACDQRTRQRLCRCVFVDGGRPHTGLVLDADLLPPRASRASNPGDGDERGGGTMKDLTVTLEDRPGRLADLGEATGKPEINIEGMCATSGGGRAEVHVLVDDAAAARKALGSAEIEVDAESDVLVIDVEDRPGTMGEVARKVAEAGINIG